MERFTNLGVIKHDPIFDEEKLDYFSNTIATYKANKKWYKEDIVRLFHDMIPDFGHKETGKYLDAKM
ncbi:hypothetical protein D3C87_1977760 [compost metagenome]